MMHMSGLVIKPPNFLVSQINVVSFCSSFRVKVGKEFCSLKRERPAFPEGVTRFLILLLEVALYVIKQTGDLILILFPWKSIVSNVKL